MNWYSFGERKTLLAVGEMKAYNSDFGAIEVASSISLR